MAESTPTVPNRTAITIKNWTYSIIFSAVFTLLVYLYYIAGGGTAEGKRMYSQLTADAGTMLIAISMLMSVISYYFDALDKKLIYRKYTGLIGFYITLVHIYITLEVLAQRPEISASGWINTGALTFGFIAFAFFIVMTALSNNFVIKAMGNKGWRLMLRYLGYSALIFVVIHFFLKKYDDWGEWFAGEAGNLLPPISLITLAICVATVVLRLIMAISTKQKESKS